MRLTGNYEIGSSVDDESIIDLQSRIAHQEHAIAGLNDALNGQQEQIARLEERVRALTDRVRALSDSMPAGETADERPPHY